MFVCSLELIYPIANLGYTNTVQDWLIAPVSPNVYTQAPSAL